MEIYIKIFAKAVCWSLPCLFEFEFLFIKYGLLLLQYLKIIHWSKYLSDSFNCERKKTFQQYYRHQSFIWVLFFFENEQKRYKANFIQIRVMWPEYFFSSDAFFFPVEVKLEIKLVGNWGHYITLQQKNVHEWTQLRMRVQFILILIFFYIYLFYQTVCI